MREIEQVRLWKEQRIQEDTVMEEIEAWDQKTKERSKELRLKKLKRKTASKENRKQPRYLWCQSRGWQMSMKGKISEKKEIKS